MNVELVVSENFRKEAKRYIKKWPGLKSELAEFQQSLFINPRQGTQLTENTYKIRLASKSKGRGKSGGFRVITYLIEIIEIESLAPTIEITLLSIYDKSEIETLSDAEIATLIDDLAFEQSEEAPE